MPTDGRAHHLVFAGGTQLCRRGAKATLMA